MIKLTPKEYLVLKRLGKESADIAYEFNTKISTVTVQIASIMRKLRVNNRTQAVIKAVQLGILDPFQFII